MKGLAIPAAWTLLTLLLLLSFAADVDNVTQGGAIDLRNRITGIRLLADHLDPYHYKWDESQPPEYCDPFNNPLLSVSKTTSTPALLLLHEPLARLPYRLAQFLWLPLQWLFLLGTAWLWLRRCSQPLQRLGMAAIVTGFTYTAAWRLHAERGQAYVLLLFLFAWWLAATLDPKAGARFLTGLLAGLLATLRPSFLILFPFLFLHRRSQLPGAVAGLLLGIGLPLLMNPSGWPDYASAMQTHSEFYRTGTDPRPPLRHFPLKIEGVDSDTLAAYVPIPFADFSFHGLLREMGLEPFPGLPPLLAAGALFLGWLWWTRVERIELLLLGMAAWFFLVDLFLPAYRNTYNDVLMLNVMALGLLALPKGSPALGCCLAALPLSWIVYAAAPTEAWLINLPTLLFTLGAILFLAPRNIPANSPSR